MNREEAISLLREGKLEEWNQRRKSGEEIPSLSEVDLSGFNLSRFNLSGAVLRVAVLLGANLSGANLRVANLSNADLRGADLRDANLRDANLSNANLRDANLRDANLSNANLRGADLSNADLRGADLRGADLRGADLRGADLRDANLGLSPVGGTLGGGFIWAGRESIEAPSLPSGNRIEAPSLPSDDRVDRRVRAIVRRASYLLTRLIFRDRRATDPVDCTVFAPPSVARGDCLSVQVFAHRPDQAEEARGLAQEFDQQARKRGFKSLEMGIERGTRLTFHLLVPGVHFRPWMLSLVWQGRANYVHFAASAPSELPIGTLIGRVTVGVDNIPVGSILFKLEIVEKNVPLTTSNTLLSAAKANRPVSLLPVGDRIRRYKKAFISYASKDRPEVLKRIQMLRLARIRYFQDVLKLEPGERWERKLYYHIDRSDLFLLFWSTNAKESKWVLEEVRYAIKRKGGNELAPPDVIPVIIEGPPVPLPPEDLAYLHFNDYLLYFMVPPETKPQEGKP